MLRSRDPRVVPAAAHSRRHASVKEWVDKIASLFELEAFPIGWCLLDHLASRDDKTLGLFAMGFFGNPPIEYFAIPRSDKFVHCLPASLNGRGNLKGFCGLSAAAMLLLVG
jgi:hypothetical protein